MRSLKGILKAQIGTSHLTGVLQTHNPPLPRPLARPPASPVRGNGNYTSHLTRSPALRLTPPPRVTPSRVWLTIVTDPREIWAPLLSRGQDMALRWEPRFPKIRKLRRDRNRAKRGEMTGCQSPPAWLWEYWETRGSSCRPGGTPEAEAGGSLLVAS